MKKVTINDVAKAANVSSATVSRVINDSSVVKEETRLRVRATIERLGYKPNAIAQGLALQKTTSIALVIPEASFTYTGQIINGILDVAKIYKYNVILHTITEGISEINELVENIIKSRVDGAIIYNNKIEETQLKALNKYDIPIVVIGNRVSGDNLSSVYVNIEQAVTDLVRKYLANNVKDIAVVQDRKNVFTVEQILKGAKKAFQEENLTFNKFIDIPEQYRSSYAFLSEYFKDNRAEVVIVNRDSQALACLNAAKENGIKVPEDMQIVCVIDTKYNAMVRPQVSGFAIPSYDLGAVAMRQITKMLSDEPEYDKTVELSCFFTPRQSSHH